MAAEAYCVKCKAKREIKDAVQITMKNGRPATEGKCPVCGTKMFKIGAAWLHSVSSAGPEGRLIPGPFLRFPPLVTYNTGAHKICRGGEVSADLPDMSKE